MSNNNKNKRREKKNKLISHSIYNLVIPYLEEEPKRIMGIYLHKYQISNKKIIEVIILENYLKSNKDSIASSKVDETEIYLSLKYICNYKTDLKLQKELVFGDIIHDENNKLSNKKIKYAKNSEIRPFYNQARISASIVEESKRLIKEYKNS